jgi:TonB-like protein
MNRLIGLLAAAAMIGTLCATARAAEELPPPIYVIKQDVPSIGTNIPRKVATSSDIPINRRYGELTPAEQETVKSRYEAMMPLDEPPYPADGLLPLFNAIRKVQDAVLAQGDLTMFVDVDAQGRATSVSVMKSPDPKLTQAVASVLMLTKYKPAVCGGQPCSMGYPFRMKFSVDR